MVRLVILAAILSLSACSNLPTEQAQEPFTIESAPAIQRLDDGQHHPAIASLLGQAEQARQRGRLTTAARYIDQAREIEPRNPEIFYRQGWLALQQAQAVDAESFARRGLVFAVKKSTIEVQLKLLLADSLEQQGRLMEALAIRGQLNAY